MSDHGHTCSLCNKSFSSDQELTEHKWSLIHHINLEKLTGKKVAHFCDGCLMRYDDLPSYGRHLESEKHRTAVNSLRWHGVKGEGVAQGSNEIQRERKSHWSDGIKGEKETYSSIRKPGSDMQTLKHESERESVSSTEEWRREKANHSPREEWPRNTDQQDRMWDNLSKSNKRESNRPSFNQHSARNDKGRLRRYFHRSFEKRHARKQEASQDREFWDDSVQAFPFSEREVEPFNTYQKQLSKQHRERNIPMLMELDTSRSPVDRDAGTHSDKDERPLLNNTWQRDQLTASTVQDFSWELKDQDRRRAWQIDRDPNHAVGEMDVCNDDLEERDGEKGQLDMIIDDVLKGGTGKIPTSAAHVKDSEQGAKLLDHSEAVRKELRNKRLMAKASLQLAQEMSNDRMERNDARVRDTNRREDKSSSNSREINKQVDVNGSNTRDMNRRVDASGSNTRDMNRRVDASGSYTRDMNRRVDASGSYTREVNKQGNTSGSYTREVNKQGNTSGSYTREVNKQGNTSGSYTRDAFERMDMSDTHMNELKRQMDKSVCNTRETASGSHMREMNKRVDARSTQVREVNQGSVDKSGSHGKEKGKAQHESSGTTFRVENMMNPRREIQPDLHLIRSRIESSGGYQRQTVGSGRDVTSKNKKLSTVPNIVPRKASKYPVKFPIGQSKKPLCENLEKKALGKLINMPRTYRERRQIRKILQNYSETQKSVARPRLHQIMPSEQAKGSDSEIEGDAQLDLNLDELPADIKSEITDLIDSVMVDLDYGVTSEDWSGDVGNSPPDRTRKVFPSKTPRETDYVTVDITESPGDAVGVEEEIGLMSSAVSSSCDMSSSRRCRQPPAISEHLEQTFNDNVEVIIDKYLSQSTSILRHPLSTLDDGKPQISSSDRGCESSGSRSEIRPITIEPPHTWSLPDVPSHFPTPVVICPEETSGEVSHVEDRVIRDLEDPLERDMGGPVGTNVDGPLGGDVRRSSSSSSSDGDDDEVTMEQGSQSDSRSVGAKRRRDKCLSSSSPDTNTPPQLQTSLLIPASSATSEERIKNTRAPDPKRAKVDHPPPPRTGISECDGCLPSLSLIQAAAENASDSDTPCLDVVTEPSGVSASSTSSDVRTVLRGKPEARPPPSDYLSQMLDLSVQEEELVVKLQKAEGAIEKLETMLKETQEQLHQRQTIKEKLLGELEGIRLKRTDILKGALSEMSASEDTSSKRSPAPRTTTKEPVTTVTPDDNEVTSSRTPHSSNDLDVETTSLTPTSHDEGEEDSPSNPDTSTSNLTPSLNTDLQTGETGSASEKRMSEQQVYYVGALGSENSHLLQQYLSQLSQLKHTMATDSLVTQLDRKTSPEQADSDDRFQGDVGERGASQHPGEALTYIDPRLGLSHLVPEQEHKPNVSECGRSEPLQRHLAELTETSVFKKPSPVLSKLSSRKSLRHRDESSAKESSDSTPLGLRLRERPLSNEVEEQLGTFRKKLLSKKERSRLSKVSGGVEGDTDTVVDDSVAATNRGKVKRKKPRKLGEEHREVLREYLHAPDSSDVEMEGLTEPRKEDRVSQSGSGNQVTSSDDAHLDRKSQATHPMTTNSKLDKRLKKWSKSVGNTMVTCLKSKDNILLVGCSNGSVYSFSYKLKQFHLISLDGPKSHASAVQCVLVSPAHNIIFSGGADCTLLIHSWQGTSNKVLMRQKLAASPRCMVQDGQMVYIGLDNGTIQVLDKKKLVFHDPIWNGLQAVTQIGPPFSGLLCIISEGQCEVKVRDIATGQLVQTIEGHTKPPLALLVCNSKVITGGLDNMLMRHSLKTGELTESICKQAAVVALATGRNSNMLCVATAGGIISLYNNLKSDELQTRKSVTALQGRRPQAMLMFQGQLVVIVEGKLEVIDVSSQTGIMLCQFPSCSQQFNVISELRRHMISHHMTNSGRIKPCRLPRCYYQAPSSVQLTKHIDRHIDKLYKKY